MSGRTRRSSSIYDITNKPTKSNGILEKKIYLSNTKLTVGLIIGGILTLLTVVLYCIAYFTPHWKEIAPNAPSVYVDGVDALIRNEILVYFNSVHRFTRHSYGLFHRCEYRFGNLTKANLDRIETLNANTYLSGQKCTKNFLPSYTNEKFNECHSLQYYRFCSKTSGRIFDIGNDYLRAAFDITIDTIRNTALKASCDCYYPEYIIACHILGIITFICLILMVVVYGLFPFLKTRHQCMKYKCLGIVSWIFSLMFMLTNILVYISYLEYESLEYVIGIERHYRSSQIYSLSQDAKTATERFRSSIKIETGYSTKLAWLAFFLSIIDGLFMLFTCRVKHGHDDITLKYLAISHSNNSVKENAQNENIDQDSALGLFLPIDSSPKNSPVPSPVPSLNPSIPAISTVVMNNYNEQLKIPLAPPRSCLKRTSKPHVCIQEEV